MRTDIVGLVPAAGHATRLGTIPCSKEIFPIGYQPDADGRPRPVAACESLIEKFRRAGADRVFMVLREGKWDIPGYLGDGQRFGVNLGYLMTRLPFGQPFTLDAAHPFVRDATVLLGFPDIVFGEDDAFVRLLEHKEATGADVVLGLFPARRPEKMDMVRMSDTGALVEIVIKPRKTDLTRTWLVAAWSPVFTEYLHEYVAARLRDGTPTHASGRELYVGDVIHAALRDGLSIETVPFPDIDYADIGTPDELVDTVRRRLLGPESPGTPAGSGASPQERRHA